MTCYHRPANKLTSESATTVTVTVEQQQSNDVTALDQANNTVSESVKKLMVSYHQYEQVLEHLLNYMPDIAEELDICIEPSIGDG